MMNANIALEQLLGGLMPALKEAGFSQVKQEEDSAMAVFAGEPGTLRVRLEDNRAALQFSESTPEDAVEYRQLALSLLELDQATEKDCKYIASDFAEVILEKFRKRKKGVPAQAKKMPKSVSKAAIRSGDAYYDALAFGNSFTNLYPELRPAYKANYEKYGEFLAEEFFIQQGNALVMRIIHENDHFQMNRLFALFNDVYENGVNDVQSLVAVTVLGSLNNDQALLARCADYMSKDLAPVVIRVNKYLVTHKRAQAKMENPPPYKPKKKKKQGFFSQMMGGGGQPGL